MKDRRVWLIATFLFVAGDAMAMQSRGALLASFQAEFAVSESLLGLVAPAGTVGFIVAILAVGLLAGRMDVRLTLLVGTAGTSVALIVLALAPLYWMFLTALLLQGAAVGVFRAIDRPFLSHLYPGNLGRVFVLYGLAWAVGAATGPVVASAVLRVTDWQITYLLMACWFLPIVVILSWAGSPEAAWSERKLDVPALRRLLRRRPIRGMLVAMVLLGGIEGTIFTWLPYYGATFLDRDLANAALSVYLLAYVPGRLVYTRLVDRSTYLRLAMVTTAAAAVALSLAFGGTTGYPMLIAVFGAGFLVSALFPLVSAFGVEVVPEYSGPVSALATAATYLGIAVVPAVVGVLAGLFHIGVAMWILTLLAVALFGSLWQTMRTTA